MQISRYAASQLHGERPRKQLELNAAGMIFDTAQRLELRLAERPTKLYKRFSDG